MSTWFLDADGDLWRGLAPTEIDRVARLFQPRRYAAGESLMRQGAISDGLLLIETGEVEVVRELPGDARIRLDRMGPGAAIGEIGLLVDAMRLASIVAAAPVTARALPAAAFRAAAESLDPTLLAVARNVLMVMSARLRHQIERLLNEPDDPAVAYAAAPAGDTGRPAEPPPPDFDWRAFAPILPTFRHFRPDDLDRLLDAARATAAGRGGVIWAADAPATRAAFVLRGAVAGVARRDGGAFSLNVMAPGELVGAGALIDGGPAAIDYVAKEATTLMELDAGDFAAMRARDDALGLALIKATAESLARAFARTNNGLGARRRLARANRGARAMG